MRPRHRLTLAVCAPLLALPLASPAALAQDGNSSAGPTDRASQPPRKHGKDKADQPVLITADQIVHDRDLNTVTASGHVEIDQNSRILLADHLSYNLKQDVIVATGNVSLTDADGTVSFADYMELTGDMKDAAARGIRMLMTDDSRLAAAGAKRTNGQKNVLDKAVYTACKACREHPDETPLWQLKARRVTHDEVAHDIEYDDAWLEFEGVPVAYTPYISHADPALKRKSGLLPPSIFNNHSVGTGLRLPYFQVIDPNQDVTLTPMFTTKQGPLLSATHRFKGFDGESKTTVSIAEEKGGISDVGNDTVGWHIDAYSRFDINDTWRAGWQIQRASDKTYLQRYGFRESLPYLTTHPYLESFGDHDYGAIEAYSFQSLTTPSYPAGATLPSRSPTVFPMASYSWVGDPGAADSYWSMDTHTAAITRTGGTSSRRINTDTAWHLPYTSSGGSVTNFTTSMRIDGYNSDHLTTDEPGQSYGYRTMPSIAADWRFPMQKVGDITSQTLTPIVVASVAPPGGTSHIPNEDSLDFELDDVNIFSPQPFSGWDRVVGGPRVSYGGQYTVASRGNQSADVALGQAYQVRPEHVFEEGTGLDHNFSDFVGRAGVSPSTNVSLAYRFRVDKSSYTLRRSEINSTVGPKALQLTTSYVFFDRLNPTSVYGEREQISNTLSAQISHYWQAQAYNTENLGSNAGPVQTGMKITYDDDCFTFSADAGVKHTTSAVFADGHYLLFTVSFKTLGQIPVNVF